MRALPPSGGGMPAWFRAKERGLKSGLACVGAVRKGMLGEKVLQHNGCSEAKG